MAAWNGPSNVVTCVLCHFEVDTDDVEIQGEGGRCICLRCYLREAGKSTDMPDALRRDIEAALAEIGDK